MRKLTITTIFTILMCIALVASASAETKSIILKIGDPFMTVNGAREEIDPGRGTKPVISNGRTLLPIRSIVEKMNGSIAWNGDTREVTISSASKTIVMTIDYKVARIKDQSSATADWTDKTLDVGPKIINGRTMVPLRFVTEELGAGLEWEQATKTVTLTFDATEKDPLNWSGTWGLSNDEGVLVLNQVGNTVGTLKQNDTYGKITGTVSENTLTGRWFYDISNQGDIILTISEDGTTFRGKTNIDSPENPFTEDPEDPEAGWFSIGGQRE